jgi:SNF2 family DNA or RNA helicase
MSVIWKPRGFQRHMIDFALNVESGAWWVDMGLGKTSSAAMLLKVLLYDYFSVRRVLIVGPKRVAYKAWPDELAKWTQFERMKYRLIRGEDFGLTPSFTTVDKWHPVLENIVKSTKKGKLQFGYDADDALANRHAKASTKKRLLSLRERIHIVSWDFLPYLEDVYGANWPYDMVVLDESSFVKNMSTVRFQACRAISNKTARMLELTGTPATRNLLDLWSQLFLLDKGERLGTTFGGYREAFFSPDKQGYAGGQLRVFSYKADKGAKEKIYKRVDDLVMSLKSEDWLDLPERVENRIYVELPKKAREFYDEIEDQLIAQINGATVKAQTSSVLFGKCLQIANGTVFDQDKISHLVHDAKLEALKEIAEATPGNLLVMYSYRPEIERFKKFFGKKARMLVTDKDLDEWNAGLIPFGYAHPASLGHGTNLQDGGSNIVWMGPPTNLEHWLQANKRLHRSGQSAERVIINCLYAQDTLDDHVRDVILAPKEQGQGDLIDAVRARIGARLSRRG